MHVPFLKTELEEMPLLGLHLSCVLFVNSLSLLLSLTFPFGGSENRMLVDVRGLSRLSGLRLYTANTLYLCKSLVTSECTCAHTAQNLLVPCTGCLQLVHQTLVVCQVSLPCRGPPPTGHSLHLSVVQVLRLIAELFFNLK